MVDAFCPQPTVYAIPPVRRDHTILLIDNGIESNSCLSGLTASPMINFTLPATTSGFIASIGFKPVVMALSPADDK